MNWHPIEGGKTISAIIYDKKGKPICYRCGGQLINTLICSFTCPHCDNRLCKTCNGSLVYSSSLKEFLCFNEDCPHYCFGAEKAVAK